MAQPWPTRGTPLWDVPLKAYLDEREIAATADKILVPTDAGIDIWGLAGQSNSAGRAYGYDVDRIDTTDPNVLSFGIQRIDGGSSQAEGNTYGGKWAMAKEPLAHPDGANGMGFGTRFARALRTMQPSNRRIGLVPRAYGGTGFAANWWNAGNPGDSLYELLIAGMLAAKAAAGPNSRIRGILWHQGESDQAETNAVYRAQLDALIDGLRIRLATPDLLFLIGQMVPDSLDASGNGNRRGINNVHIDTARRKERVAFFYGSAGHVETNGGADLSGNHYDVVGQRALGVSASEAFLIADKNILGTPALPVRSITLTQVASTVNVLWERPLARVTNYNVRYRVAGVESWTPLTRPSGAITSENIDRTATITGITNGDTIQVEVQTVNETGSSAWLRQSIATVTAPAQVAGVTVGTTTQATAPVSWSVAPRAAFYRVEYRVTGSGSAYTVFGSTTGIAVTLLGLLPNTGYDLRITGVNAAGDGTSSTVTTFNTTALDILHNALPTADQATVFGYWSLARRLIDTHTGVLFRVRNTTTNVETDIGQTAAKVADEAAMVTAAAGGDLALVKVYKQGSVGADVGQTSIANQPLVCIAGTVIKINGRVAALQTATQLLENTAFGLYAAGGCTVYAVMRSTGGGSGIVSETGTGGNPRYYPASVGTGGNTMARLVINDAGTSVINANTAPQKSVSAGYHCVGVRDTGSSSEIRQDGVSVETLAYVRTGVVTPARFSIMGGHNGSSYTGLVGYWSEVVAFTGARSTVACQAIEANEAAWYATAV